jgi:hypothetical protein
VTANKWVAGVGVCVCLAGFIAGNLTAKWVSIEVASHRWWKFEFGRILP